jgi:hypothetical protein
MIYFTFKASSNVVQGQFVQLSTDKTEVENHTTGSCVGLCRSVYNSEDDGVSYAEIYQAGGGGQRAVLNDTWNGAPSRFDIVNAKVQPVSSGGVGWIIPEFPQAGKIAGDSVFISI